MTSGSAEEHVVDRDGGTDDGSWPLVIGTEETVCGMCAASPAVRATLRSMLGVIFFYRISSLSMPLCRECGIDRFGVLTSRTLWQGWWVIFLFVLNPIFILLNFIAYLRFRRLPPGTGGPWGWMLRRHRSGRRRRYPWGSVVAGIVVLLYLLYATTMITLWALQTFT